MLFSYELCWMLNLHCFSNVGDKKVQRADQDPDGFVNSEEETGVEVEGR